MSTEYPEFIADNDYRAQDGDQLSFRKGERLYILDGSTDWWFARTAKGEEGWIPPSYGHIDERVVRIKPSAPTNAPYAALSDTAKLSDRDVILADILNTEYKFTSLLQEFIETVILPIEVRDTPFKRSFMEKVASSFTLFLEIHKACSSFLNNYKKAFEARDMSAIGSLFLQFASSLRLFGQYITLNSNLLNEVKSFQKGIQDFLLTSPLKHGNIETYLILPLQHYLHYLHHLNALMQLTPPASKDHKIITDAHDLLKAYSAEVDEKLQEEKSKIELLSIQSQFIGNPKIYQPSRVFIRSGDVERIGDEKKAPKHYMAHLFNDAFMYSSYVGLKNGLRSRMFKFHKVFDLSQCQVDRYKTSEHLYAFQLKGPITTVFRCTSDQEAHDWVTAIQKQIDAAVSLPTRKSSLVVLNALKLSAAVDAPAPSNTRRLSNFQSQLLQGVDASTLGNRASIVYNFLRDELEMAESLARLYQVMIRPLLDASKGATLTVGHLETEGTVGERDKSLFQESNSALAVLGGTLSRMQAQSITDTLQNADMQIFLNAAESITQTTMEFLSLLETRCISARWTDSQCLLGDAFVSLLAENIYQQYISYVNGYLAALRIMESSNLQKFKAQAEHILTPHNFANVATFPRYAVVRYIEFNQRLLSFTPPQHAEHASLQQNISKLKHTLEIIDNVLKIKKNYEKLLSIYNSFITLNVLYPDPVLTNLVSNDRVFIKEGPLIKVCRKKNKTFQFFLFNDYLLYGSALPNGLYQYSRSLDLTQCQVEMKNVNGEKAFEILNTEKSFIVMASTSIELMDWFDTLAREIAAIKQVKGSSMLAAAPVWVADSAADGCCVCKAEFKGFFNRRHHCRMCGLVVCGEHSKNKLVLPNIHKTEKQRVCDTCFHTGKPSTSSSTASLPASPPASSVSTTEAKSPSASAPKAPPKPTKSPVASSVSPSTVAPPVPPRPNSGSKPLPPVPKIPIDDDMPSAPPPPVPSRAPAFAPAREVPTPPVTPSSGSSVADRIREMQQQKSTPASPASSSNNSGSGASSVADRIREMQLKKSNDKPATSPSVSRSAPSISAAASSSAEYVKPAVPARQSSTPPASSAAPPAPPKPVKPIPTDNVQSSPKPDVQPGASSLPVSRPPPPAPKPEPESAVDVPPPPRREQPPPPPPPPKERRPSINNPPPRPPPPPPPRAHTVTPESDSSSLDSSPRVPDPRSSLLLSIQAGSQKLRTVSVAEKKKEPPAGDAGGILGMLATMISDRRISMQEEDIDDDSDASGFSDSDSD